jgi:hypothetical protein
MDHKKSGIVGINVRKITTNPSFLILNNLPVKIILQLKYSITLKHIYYEKNEPDTTETKPSLL